MAPPQPSGHDEFEVLRRYLRHRIEQWLLENRDRQAKDFAQLSGISAGWVSAIRKGERFGPDKIASICDALEITVREAFDEAAEWAKAQPKRASSGRSGAASESMQIALRQLELEGRTASDAVLDRASTMMRQRGDQAVDRWREILRGLITVDEMGELEVRAEDTRHEGEHTKRRPRAKKLPPAVNSTPRPIKPKGDH